MRKSSTFFIGIIICMGVIGASYFWTTGLMNSIYAYRSPLHNSPPAPGEALGTPNTRSFVIVLIDGLRLDTSLNSNVMPYLNQLRNQGATAVMHSHPPSYSEPGYSVILTGAWPDISDGPAMNLDYADIPTFTQDNLYSAAHRSGLMTAVAGFNWFEKLIPQQAVTESYYTTGEDQIADRLVTATALPWLQQGRYQLVLIHLDQVDTAGHYEGGPTDPNWDAAASRADGLLREIANAMDLRKDTLLVISDHGHIDRGGHGGQEPVVLEEPFVMAGKGVIPGKYGDIQMVDVAPTVAAILGLSIPALNEGHPLVAVFDFTLDQVNNINKAVSTQQEKLAQDYQTAIGHPITVIRAEDIVSATQAGMNAAREAVLDNQRLPRGIIAIFIFFLFINLAVWNAKPYTNLLLLGVIIYLVVFNLKYTLIDHKTYSLSSVVSAMNLIITTGLTSMIATLVAWILVFIGAKGYRLRPKQASDLTMKFILVTLAILTIPIFVHFVIDGATVTWALPNFLIGFLGLLFLVQTLIVAVAGLVLTGLSALIGVFAPRESARAEKRWK